ncbi:hypothetical protein [Acidimangrovimonas sediminis]|uniref:hypothetical protein n=1 Tax=Acidimangrovimonas sediminis TaxID=2056283 RepID=UPI000C7FC512|nr:hypothetical protein [Acidimangrovimonas sediminis]
MTVPSWPSELPKPTRSDWQGQYDDPRLKRARDTGPPGYRRRWSSVARQVSLAIIIPRALKQVFDTFFAETTAFGSLPFWMPDPTTDGWALLSADGTPILNGAGAPLLLSARWLCLFGDQLPVETVKGPEFKIAFSVSVMP